MRFLKSLIAVCITLCGIWATPNPAIAQSADFKLDPPNLDPISPIAHRPVSPDTPATRTIDPFTFNSSSRRPGESDAASIQPSYACACGCGIYEVGTRSMLPQRTGLTVYFEYDYQDQNFNWSGTSRAPAENNDDKEIRTSFFTTGFQYMFNRYWGIQAQLPVADRYFKTTGGATGDDVIANHWRTIGDLRLEGIYDGFFPDQSAGVTFGAKLPTGNFTHNDAFGDIDRDTQIGTGSTDVLFGGFYRNDLNASGSLGWFAQLNLDLPVLIQDHYHPGVEVDSALGIYLNGLRLGSVGIIPIAQVLDGWRARDTGENSADPVASGYQRVLFSPGIEFDLHPLMFYADIEVPVYQHVTGNQLVASTLCKLIVSYHF